MIDWLSARVPLDWQSPINEGKFLRLRPDGEIEFSVDCRKVIEGSWSSAVTVRSVERGFVEISGNITKFLQGHNLFGTDDLRCLFIDFMFLLCDKLSITPSLSDVRSWVSGSSVTISRIDLTYSFSLSSRAEVRQWLQAAGQQASVRWRGRGHFQDGTLTFGKAKSGSRASRWQLVVYCKADEFDLPRSRLPDSFPSLDLLRSWVENKLRVEVRLRSEELRDRGLRSLDKWANVAVSDVHAMYFGKVQLGSEVTVTVDRLEGLKPRHRAWYAAWQSGADLRDPSVMPRRTFFRVRSEILSAVGVDIGVRCSVSNVVPLVRVLTAVPAADPVVDPSAVYRPSVRALRLLAA